MTKQSDTNAEIARRLLKAGLEPHEALEQIYPVEYEDSKEEPTAEALQLFASSLCGHKSSDKILEYAFEPYLLTAQIVGADAAHRWSVMTHDKTFAEILRILFAGKGPSIFESVANLSSAITYSSIICLLPWKGFLSEDFGGETVRELLPHLSEKGTLYWITGQQIGFDPSVNRTFADFESLGFHVAGFIEMAPGAFMMSEGAIIALRHEVPK